MTERMHTNFACADCGKPISDVTAHWYKGRGYCRDCYGDNHVACEICGLRTPCHFYFHSWLCQKCLAKARDSAAKNGGRT